VVGEALDRGIEVDNLRMAMGHVRGRVADRRHSRFAEWVAALLKLAGIAIFLPPLGLYRAGNVD
jgi:hypothetical protein